MIKKLLLPLLFRARTSGILHCCLLCTVLSVYKVQAAYAGTPKNASALLTPAIETNFTVQGKVSDSKGALAGVSVLIKGTSVGVATDNNGNFSLSVPENGVLVFKFLGYKTVEMPVKNGQFVNVVLVPDNSNLNEVVVVGYGSKQLSQISSSVSVISGDKLRDVTSNDLGTLLEGKAAGVVASGGSGDPTGGADILIRGVSSINAGTSPLIVVDGNIGGTYNTSDIATVTILKDAAATGLYGSRASNGVIIITTKKGQAGQTAFNLNSTTGLSIKSTGNLHLMNSQQLYDFQKTFETVDPSVLKYNTNWFDLAFRRGVTQNHTLSASGGNDKTQYYISGNFYKEQGTLIQNDKTDYNFRTNITTKLTDKLKLSLLINSIYEKDNYPTSNSLGDAYLNLPYDPAYNADGTPTDGRTYPGWLGRDKENFLQGTQYNFSDSKSIDNTIDLNLDYNILNHLTFSTYNRVSYYESKSVSYYDARTKDGGADNGDLYNSLFFSTRLLSSNRLKYSNSIANNNFSILAVGEGETYHDEANGSNGKGLPPGRPFLSTATDIISNPTGGNDDYNFSKYLAQGDYNYNEKYFAVGSVVHEVSSRFGDSHPGGTFVQGGASWIISKENFFEGIKSINFLKLRASYGTTGNAEIGNYAAKGLYTIDQSASYAGFPGAYPSQKANPNLTWERLNSANIGLDIGILNRIDLTLDAYDKRSSGLLFQKPLPATSGYSYVYENVGSIRNQGFEFNIKSRNLVGAFKWETDLNMAFNRSKVLSLADGEQQASAGSILPIAVGHDINDWYMPIWAGVNPANGDPQWEKIVTDANGKKYVALTNSYASATKQYTGTSASPKFTGGITNNFSYKGFSLSAFFNFVYGNKIYNSSRALFDSDGLYDSYNSIVPPNGWTRWMKPGDIATEPKAVQGGNHDSNSTSSRYLEDGSYLRLKNVTFGYSFTGNVLNALSLKSLRVYVSGDNLLTFTKFSGNDPEVSLNATSGAGFSSLPYPTSRKVLFGLNVGF